VQVKSEHRVSASKGGGYHVRACSHRRWAYRASEIDILVAYVVPLDAWYMFSSSGFCEDEIDAVVSGVGEEEV
jgi:hypothetical protein